MPEQIYLTAALLVGVFLFGCLVRCVPAALQLLDQKLRARDRMVPRLDRPDLYKAAYWLRDRQRPPRSFANASPAWVDFATAVLLRAEIEFGICQPGLTPSIEQTKAPFGTLPAGAVFGPPLW